MFHGKMCPTNTILQHFLYSYPARAISSKGLSNRVDFCPYVDKNIENTNNLLKYAVIHSE